jgi:DNA polymerase III epsilon subunit-like protein
MKPAIPRARDGQESAEPVEHLAGRPVYRWGQAPDKLRTRAQLEAKRRKPKPGAEPVAYLRFRNTWAGRGVYTYADLFGPKDTAPMRPLSPAVIARRTCQRCAKVKAYTVRGGICEACKEHERARTCYVCRTVRATAYPTSDRRCRACKAKAAADARAFRRKTEAEAASRDRSCPQCRRRTATAAIIAAWRTENPGRIWRPRYHPACEADLFARLTSCPDCGTTTATAEDVQAYAGDGARPVEWFGRRVCEPCQVERKQRDEQERQAARERAAAAEQARRDWARAALDDPECLILDAETTGLHADARIVELSIITTAGAVVFDSLINPGEPIPAQASAIHGITDADVQRDGVPTFAGVVEQLAAALHGRRVLIYNAEYDAARLHHELTLYHLDRAAAADAQAQASAWLDAVTVEDVMMPYSRWVGEIHEYYGDIRWQPLGGGHRALSDCRTVITRLSEIAGVDVDELAPAG